MSTTTDSQIIEATISFVKTELKNAEGGHDWWHIYRVWKSAREIAKKEQANLFIVELGALLHDIADSKFHNGDETIGPKKNGYFPPFNEFTSTNHYSFGQYCSTHFI